MTKEEVVQYYQTHITDWIINNTGYGFGEFNTKSEEIPVQIFGCISVNNNIWDWSRDSYIPWAIAVEIIQLMKKYKRLGKEKKKIAVGSHLERIRPKIVWTIKQRSGKSRP